ncbi:hypothetical protein [Rhodococcus rhodochrous]|uniref:Membrane protein n=1 Tax=Rhodococcus rhodochrous KG-21 TaxID=1441923 RepID=A0A0M8PMK4_RHORH|nr:hypothetical protein [Rhodococcus rhodochrous]KOS58015.1 membrane protein [Rhodococcus rhodochrous KG-21]
MSERSHAGTSPGWLAFGVVDTAVVVTVSVAAWYLLADPQFSPFDLYPLPFNALLFWALLFVVWAGFNLEFWGFDRLRQPWRGLVFLGATSVFAVVVTYVLASGIGHLYPDFAADRPDGLGYFTGALFVLFGFSTWVLVVLNWGHWPWTDLGLKQPWVGACEIVTLLVPTALLYFVLGVPAVSDTVREGAALFDVDTLLGWYYSIIVAIVLTGQTLENWPWRLAGSRMRIALVSTIGNIALGTMLFVTLRAVCTVLVGAGTAADPGFPIDQFPAQLGVCWVAWMILWANAFGNKPTEAGAVANLVSRVAITFALAVITFVLYYYVVAEIVLHEPAVTDGLHGNALGFMDLFALVTLLYVVGFESFGIRRPTVPAPEDRVVAHP